MKIRSELLLFTALLPLAAPAADSSARAAPNIVYILADDLGYGDVQCFNPQRGKIPTPHMDRLAREGMMLTDAHSGSAVCTPTRYGVLTGRYAWRTRLQEGVLWGLSAPLITPDRFTVGKLLQQQGYETAGFGKWHLGMDFPGGPTDAPEVDDVKIEYSKPIGNGPVTRGFDTFFGISASLDMAPYVYVENDRAHTPATMIQHEWFRSGISAADFHAINVLSELTQRVTDYIGQRPGAGRGGAKPFFIYCALTSPHTPIVPEPAWKGRSGLGEYGDFVMQTDAAVGAILAALDRAGLAQNTLVIVTSDNGCSANPAKAAELEKLGHYPSAQFHGYKSDIWEGGHRVPFIARWPGHIRAESTSDRTTCLTDLLATAAELTGAKVPANAGEDSVSLLPTLLGRSQAPRPAVIHHSISGHFAIREGRWKLILAAGSAGWSSPTEVEAAKRKLPEIQLYDMDADPGEQHNIAAGNPAVVARLDALLTKYVAEGRSTPGAITVNDVPITIRKTLQSGVPIAAPKKVD
ncbi:Arylsulfatase [uncultured Defluviicoccus sp.]|uniref:Arylsulfatase n=1 Tax=metagenome TaxID=256318 RepID=A0A380TE69_9ZZZZ|nr:Arylsulfatase [uncultured Defluviicoccus sp.]